MRTQDQDIQAGDFGPSDFEPIKMLPLDPEAIARTRQKLRHLIAQRRIQSVENEVCGAGCRSHQDSGPQTVESGIQSVPELERQVGRQLLDFLAARRDLLAQHS